eukprot:5760441-Prymnesium_polylepis.1
MRAALAPPELRSATGHVVRPVARTMPGDVISPVHNQASIVMIPVDPAWSGRIVLAPLSQPICGHPEVTLCHPCTLRPCIVMIRRT